MKVGLAMWKLLAMLLGYSTYMNSSFLFVLLMAFLALVYHLKK